MNSFRLAIQYYQERIPAAKEALERGALNQAGQVRQHTVAVKPNESRVVNVAGHRKSLLEARGSDQRRAGVVNGNRACSEGAIGGSDHVSMIVGPVEGQRAAGSLD